MKQTKLYTLIPLEEFKAVLSGDDRDDKLSRYCLTISSFTIEQHCHKRFPEYIREIAEFREKGKPKNGGLCELLKSLLQILCLAVFPI